MFRRVAFSLSIAGMLTLLAPPVGANDEKSAEDRDTQRRYWLKKYTFDTIQHRDVENLGGTVFAGLGVPFIVWGAVRLDDDPRQAIAWMSALGGVATLTGTAWAFGERPRDMLLPTMPLFAIGGAMLGFAVSEERWVIPRPSAVGAVVGMFGTGLLYGINLAGSYGAVAELRQKVVRLRTGVDWSPQELAAAEQALRDTAMPIGRFVVALPLLVGTVWTSIPAFQKSYSSKERVASGAMGFMSLIMWSAMAYRYEPISQYLFRLHSLGFEAAVGPGSVSIMGRF